MDIVASAYRFDITPPIDRSPESYSKFLQSLQLIRTIGSSCGKGILVMHHDHRKNNIIRIINGDFIGAQMRKILTIETFCDLPLTNEPVVKPHGHFILMDVPSHINEVCWELYCKSPTSEYQFIFASEYEAKMTFLQICGEYDMPTNAYIIKHYFQSYCKCHINKEVTILLPSNCKL